MIKTSFSDGPRDIVDEKEVLDIINENQQDIFKQIGSKFDDDKKYEVFMARYIKVINRESFDNEFVIMIKKDDFDNSKLPKTQEFKELILTELRNNRNQILLNENLEVKRSYKNKNDDLHYKAQVTSQSKFWVFYFADKRVYVYRDGVEKIDPIVFIDDSDYIEYLNRKQIHQLREVIEEYRNSYLPNNTDVFFVNNEISSTLGHSGMMFKNKPEEIIKKDLQRFLNTELQYYFTTDAPVDNTRREIMDIHLDLAGDVYFIIIEWLGTSISECGMKVAEEHGGEYITTGVKKIFECVDKLKKNDRNVMKGYFIVFDTINTETCDFNKHLSIEQSDINKECIELIDLRYII